MSKPSFEGSALRSAMTDSLRRVWVHEIPTNVDRQPLPVEIAAEPAEAGLLN